MASDTYMHNCTVAGGGTLQLPNISWIIAGFAGIQAPDPLRLVGVLV